MLIATLVLIFAIDIATDKGSETAEHTRSKFYPTEVMLGGGVFRGGTWMSNGHWKTKP